MECLNQLNCEGAHDLAGDGMGCMETLWRKVPADSRCSVACDLDRIGWRAGADVDPEQAWHRTRPRGNGNGRRRELKIEWQRYDSLHMLGGCVIWLILQGSLNLWGELGTGLGHGEARRGRAGSWELGVGTAGRWRTGVG